LQVDEKYPACGKLMKDGMNFTIRIYNGYGIKIQEYPLEINQDGQLKAKIN